MKYPEKELAQIVIASCIANHIERVVISPGSRNAPLTIGFNATNNIESYSIVDERCAGFVALGMSQQNQKPTALVCTSGSAILNYYPAIAEAFYSNTPLIIISADRPKNKIDIGDGQTIRQEGVLKNHILFEANLTNIKTKVDADFNKELVYKALKTAYQELGPVHINVPFEEPLYNLSNKLVKYPLEKNIKPIEHILSINTLDGFAKTWNKSTKKIVLIGVHQPDELLQIQINKLLKDPSVLVFTETTSNINSENVINSIDQFLASLSEQDKKKLQPEILLSIGGLVVSKRIKEFLRTFKPKEHWVVHPTFGYDTFNCISQHLKTTATLFFSQFFWLTITTKSDYQYFGLKIKQNAKKLHTNYLKSTPFSDFKAIETILNYIPLKSVLQISNSAAIRYTQLFDVNTSIHVFCNRGTSGIDGSTSTAIGFAIKSKKPVTLITGDVSFLYDSNALWNQYIPPNFRIIIINNNGGGIFKILPGPKKTKALSYFETPHGLNAKYLCKTYDFKYQKAKNLRGLKYKLKGFYSKSSQPQILEVFTPSNINDKVLSTYFKTLTTK